MSKSWLKYSVTIRGFPLYQFNDSYGKACSLQESSSVEPHIWLGCTKNMPPHHVTGDELSPRMHLSRAQVEELIPVLQKFVETGDLQ